MSPLDFFNFAYKYRTLRSNNRSTLKAITTQLNCYKHSFFYCCGVSVASEQQHKQDLRRMYRREYELSNSPLITTIALLLITTFCHNALHLTKLHCATYYQSPSHHEQHEDCLLYTSPSPRDLSTSRMPTSA